MGEGGRRGGDGDQEGGGGEPRWSGEESRGSQEGRGKAGVVKSSSVGTLACR